MAISTAGMTSIMAQEWENLNPGAGGQIQQISIDPNVSGRVYYASDMEGNYVSNDSGETWEYTGRDLSSSDNMVIVVEPGNSNRIYAGLNYSGIDISDDGGATWTNVDAMNKEPIGEIAIDPKNSDIIFAGPNSRMRWTKAPAAKAGFRNDPWGKRIVYRSKDRGETWEAIEYAKGDGRRDTFDIRFSPESSDTIFIGGLSGVYRSDDGGDSWKPVTAPPKTGDSWGIDLSPDGRFLYATYQVPDASGKIKRMSGPQHPGKVLTHLFVTPTAKTQWTDLSKGKGFVAKDRNFDLTYWQPVVDPRSTDKVQKILIAPWSWRFGLWEVTVKYDGDRVTAADWDQVFFVPEGGSEEFDSGWEQYISRPLSWGYTPINWDGPRTIWTTGDQTLFSADTTSPNFPNNWDSKYTEFIKEIEGRRFYRTRGVQCTFVFDAEQLGDYVVQNNGDNAVKESFDDGYSWAVGVRRPRSNAVAITKDLDVPIVLSHVANGYGGSSTDGALWAKRVVKGDPTDKWFLIGGGKDRVAGMPDYLYNQIVVDPHNPKQVYIGTDGRGIYRIPDIEKHLDIVRRGGKAPKAEWITRPKDHKLRPLMINDKGFALVVDPDSPEVLWASSMEQLMRGTEKGGEWVWEEVLKSTPGNRIIFDVWRDGPTKFIAARKLEANGEANIVVSVDEGKTWKTIVTFDDVARLREPASWYRPELSMRPYGIDGHGDSLYFAYSNWPTSKGHGMFKAKLAPDGSVAKVEDITGDMPFPFPIKNRIVEENGNTYLLSATCGMGLWRLKL
ncbi:hypothetical protein [Rubellicoccus peritrichatus]|uniref:Sortilin N-terminal domain-containing protein n=1 Tax=Rubellicoccus peritrichatus TaxID=3080537 RepID=A0AAQ3LBK2_9BACT|nr:hypothetical protein [Puniceicoccus sp. CR14]WOO42726.1 hypothetical protein RZN69_06455 [Puniceicoccus sp. CR14]